MIISRGRRYIFVHIPKTGGTSMALALEARAMKDDIMLGDTPKAARRRRRLKGVHARGRLWKHSTLADIDGLISRDQAREMFTFTLVRNPWDRVLSYYSWLRGQHFDHYAVHAAKALDFAGFLRDARIAASLRGHPYAHYLRDAGGVERADLFIRLEHLDQDIAPLQAHLGFALQIDRVNRSARAADYRTQYGEAEREIVAQLCAIDIKRFAYSF